MIYLKLLAMAVLWGGTFIAGRLLADHVDPYSAAFLRFVIAAVCLLGLTYHFEGGLPRLRRNQFIGIVLLGLTGVFAYNILFFQALETLPAGQAAAVIAMNPAFIALLSILLFRESAQPLKLLGIGLSVFGAIVVISKGHPGSVLQNLLGAGELDIVFCMLSWVAYSLIGKRVLGGLSPLAAVAYAATAGMVLLAFPAWLWGGFSELGGYSAANWFSLVYLGLGGTVIGFVWYYQGIRQIGATRASVFINFVPISAIVLGHLVLGEAITPSLLVGTLLVIAGVYLTNRAPARVRAALVD